MHDLLMKLSKVSLFIDNRIEYVILACKQYSFMKNLIIPTVALIFLSSCYTHSYEQTVRCTYWYHIHLTFKNFDPTDFDSVWVNAQHATSAGVVRKSALYVLDSNKSFKLVHADKTFGWRFYQSDSNQHEKFMLEAMIGGSRSDSVDTDVEVVMPSIGRTFRITDIKPDGEAEKTSTVDAYHAAPMCYRDAASYNVEGGNYVEGTGAVFEK